MMDIDTLARRHAAEAHAAVADAMPPRISAGMDRAARSRRVWIAVAAAVVVVALGLPLLIERLTTDSEPVEPTTTTMATTTTTVPFDVFGFAPTGRMTFSCARCSAARLPDGRVLVVGGGEAALYDPVTETFTPTGPPQVNIGHAGLVALPLGNVLIAGRDTVVQIYDTDTGSFSVLDGVQVQGVPVRLDDGRILVVDGRRARYLDVDKGEVELAGTMAVTRGGFVVEPLRDGRVFVAGGRYPDSGGPEAELFDPETGSFTPAGPMHDAVDGFTVTALADGRLLLVGGTDESGAAVASAQVFDPATDTFSQTGSMSVPRFSHTATLLPDGRVLVVGGASGLQDDPGATAEIYDPVTGLFSPAPQPTRDRVMATAVALYDGRVLIFGHHASNMPTPAPGPSGADSAEIFSLAHYEQPEGCCAENPSELQIEVMEAFRPDDSSHWQLTVTIPPGALVGAINASLNHLLHDAHGGTGGGGDIRLPTDCEDGCTLDFPLELIFDSSILGESNTWTLTVWYMIGYEGSVPPAADGITAAIAPGAP